MKTKLHDLGSGEEDLEILKGQIGCEVVPWRHELDHVEVL